MGLTAALGRDDDAGTRACFEDFRVGQQHVVNTGSGEPRPAPDGTGPAAGPVAAGLGPFLGLVDRAGVLPGPPLRVVETQWAELPSSSAGAPVRATFTVTRCRRAPGEATGSVRWHVRADDAHGKPVQEGSVTAVVPTRSGGPADDAGEPGFCTRPWGQALAARLEADERFAAATATWDGSIGLRSGADQVQLRVYRGRVVDVAARTPHGATFTVEAQEHDWTELLTGPLNDFTRRVMSSDAFSVSGSAYEYLRMTKAVLFLIDAARDLTKGSAT